MIEPTDKPLAGLPRGRGTTLWRQVAAQLASEIRTRPPAAAAARLPSEQELARRFGVNRHTVRQAIRSLAEQGLVRAEQGRGTFIADRIVDYPLGTRTRLTATLAAQDRAPHREILAASVVPAGAEMASRLGVTADTPLHRIRSLSFADGVPIAITLLFVPVARFPQAPARLAADSSITRLYAGYGIADYRRLDTRILGRLAEPEEALLLRLAGDGVVLLTEGLDALPDGSPLALVLSTWAAERVQFLVESQGLAEGR